MILMLEYMTDTEEDVWCKKMFDTKYKYQKLNNNDSFDVRTPDRYSEVEDVK